MLRFYMFFFIYCASFITHAQEDKYWIFLVDKDTINYSYTEHLSEQAIERRLEQGVNLYQYTDIPLHKVYINRIKQENITIISQSKWLNAVTALLNETTKEKLLALPFVKKIQKIDNRIKILSLGDSINYHSTIEQMEASVLHQAQLNGDGIVIGVIDAGFVGASQNEYLEHLFDEKRILGIKDLVNPQRTEHYKFPETHSDNHGNTVLQMITGHEKGGTQYGLATKAQFYLARTDHGDNEFRGEEDYWVRAMEWMDSLGVRIINTSLGYALGFDNAEENYKPEQMDGKTSVISRAAQIAADEKGLLLVVSAGNEGNDSNWQIISTPADTQGVLSVGATNYNGLKAGYSSIGAEFLPYLKPNVVCFSFSGTSFSAPIITGLAACLMQKNRKATNKEIFSVIEKSGHLYPQGNNYLGYGIPRASKALALMENKAIETIVKNVKGKGIYHLKIKYKKEKIYVFHKKNSTIVVSQETKTVSKGKINISKPNNAQQSTVYLESGELIEIFWDKTSAKAARKAARKAKRQEKKAAKKAK